MIVSQDRIERLLTSPQVNSKEIVADCPKCGKHEFHIALLKEDHPFICNRKKHCGWTGNIYTFLTFFGELMPDKPINLNEMTAISDQKEEEQLELYLPEIHYPIGWSRISSSRYLESRGFTDYAKYEVGKIALQKNYIYFAVHMNRKLVGYVGRAILDSQYPKYKNSVTDFKKALYGFDNLVGDTVIAVEGVFDAIAVDKKLGWHSSVATFGAKFTKEQIELLKLKGIKNLYLMHESDVLQTVKKEAMMLNQHFNTKICYLGEGVDPDDATPQALFKSINDAKSPLDFNLDFIKHGLQE